MEEGGRKRAGALGGGRHQRRIGSTDARPPLGLRIRREDEDEEAVVDRPAPGAAVEEEGPEALVGAEWAARVVEVEEFPAREDTEAPQEAVEVRRSIPRTNR